MCYSDYYQAYVRKSSYSFPFNFVTVLQNIHLKVLQRILSMFCEYVTFKELLSFIQNCKKKLLYQNNFIHVLFLSNLYWSIIYKCYSAYFLIGNREFIFRTDLNSCFRYFQKKPSSWSSLNNMWTTGSYWESHTYFLCMVNKINEVTC